MTESFLRWNILQSLRHLLTSVPTPIVLSITDIREWNVEIEPDDTMLDKELPDSGRLNVALHRILIETGIAQTLATTSLDSRSRYALFRYGGDFAGTAPKLRFDRGVKDKDPRLTAIASEEVATGIACYILREHFGLVHIADVYPCIRLGELEYVSEDLESRPDYFCEDSDGKTVIAESKGATGTRSSITSKIDPEGMNQVQNVAPVNLPLRDTCSRVVIGTHFCIDGQHPRSETTTIIKDPDGEEGKNLDTESDQLMRLAYAKALRFMGQEIFSELLINRAVDKFKVLFRERQIFRNVNGIPFLPMGVTIFGDVIGFFGPVGEVLSSSSEKSLKSEIRAALSGISSYGRQGNLLPNKFGYILPDGVMIVHDQEFID